MNQNIILRMGEINESLKNIQAATESFEPALLKDMASSNHLDVVTRLNELNTQLEDVARVYKNLLTTNNDSATNAIQDFKEVDDTISASIRSR